MATLYRQALNDLNAAIDLDPCDASAFDKRGFIWETLGDLDKALADYSRAIELTPSNPTIYISRGNVYLKRADYYNAAIDETVAIQFDTSLCNPIAYFYRAQAYRGLQRWNEALVDYQTYIDIGSEGRYVRAAQASVFAVTVLIKPPQGPTEVAAERLQHTNRNTTLLIDPPQMGETHMPLPAFITSPTDLPALVEHHTPAFITLPTALSPLADYHRSSPTDINTPLLTDLPRFGTTKASKIMGSTANFLKIHSLDQIISHFRIPLFANGYALIVSSLATSGLGLLYWTIAAHLYSAATVGLNSAAISAMTFLGAMAQLNLAGITTRFIPKAGRATGRFVAGAYLLSAAVAVVISTIFLMGLSVFSPALNSFMTGPDLILWFVVSTICWTVFVIQDGVLTGLRQAIWVPIENTGFAIMKILLLFILAISIPLTGVFASWTIAVVLTILPTNLFIFRGLLPKYVHRKEPSTLKLPQIAQYAVGDYLGLLCMQATTSLLPLLVLQVAGATANAYFYMCWTMGYALYMISSNMGTSLMVEAVRDQAKLSVYSRKVFLQTLRIVVPLAVILMVGAPLILRIFGENYSSEGSLLLQLLALSAIPNVVNSLSNNVARAQGHSGVVFVVMAVQSGSVVALSYVFLGSYGIVGVGLAWTISQSIVAAILLLTRLRPLWVSRIHASKEGFTGEGHSRSVIASAEMAENNG